jgi:hypothetical protein
MNSRSNLTVRELEEYMRWFGHDAIVPPRSRSKVKSYRYPFRDIEDFWVTPHAESRMQQRQVKIEDVSLILKYGRAMQGCSNRPHRAQIFLCPGELPKGKVEAKSFARLWGVVLVVARNQPVLITVMIHAFDWHKRIFRKGRLPDLTADQQHF